MPDPTTTPDGWVVTDPNEFRFLIAHDPPRPHVVWRMLWADARNWKPLAFWAVGVGLILTAVVTGWWFLIGLGLAVLIVYARLFWSTVKYLRDAKVMIGVIADDLRPHPMMADLSTTVVDTPDGREVPVCVPTDQVADLLHQRQTVEVAFLYDRDSQYCMALGVRAAPGTRSGT